MLLFLVLLGLVVGSFLAMLTYRMPRRLSFSGRSFCDSCQRKIPWFENIPVLSFLLLRARCRSCKKRISSRYPLIELATATVFFLSGLAWLNPPDSGIATKLFSSLGIAAFLLLLALSSVFIALLVVDWEFQILPDELLAVLALLVVLAILGLPSPEFFVHLFSGLLSFLFFLAIYLLTRGRGMGFGDVKLSFVLGSLLGYPSSIVWVFLSFVTGALVGVVLLSLGRAKLGKPIPFGPYLIISAWITLFFGDKIFQWYVSLL